MNVPRKYGFLRLVAFVLKLLAWIVLIAGIAALVFGLLGLSRTADLQGLVPNGIFTLGLAAVPLIAIFWFMQLFAFGSILSLLIDVEENTRALSALPPE